MTHVRVDKNQLVERFDSNLMEIKYMPKGQVHMMPRGEISVYYDTFPLYRWSFDSGDLEIQSQEIFMSDVIEVIDRTGLYPLEVEFNSLGSNVDERAHDTVRPINLQNNQTIIEFVGWFNKICHSLGNIIFLIPDTNFLRRHYYNNFLMNILTHPELIDTTRIVIPRLCILEIENKYNRSSSPSSGNGKKDEDHSQDVFKRYSVGKERRVGLSSIKEVISIRKNGGNTNPNISNSLLESFSYASGKKLADHWIRKEVQEFISSLNDRFTRNKQGETTIQKASIIFMTCDIMNSLAAVSEDINTFYILRKEPRELHVSTPLIFTNLVYNTAIQFGECTCCIKYYQKETFNVKGMWEGKTTYDWLTDKIQINDSIPNGNSHT